MTPENLEKELNSEKPLSSVYLLYGEEKFLLDNCFKKIKKKFGELLQGINYVLLDENSVDNLIYEIESPAFGYDKKLIIVKNSNLFKKDGRRKTGTPIQEQVASYFNENKISNDVVLVFVEDTADKNDVFDAISKQAVIVQFTELDELSLIRKLKQIANLYKVNVSESDLKYFIEISGTNMQYLINEIRKLIEFAAPRRNNN